MIRALNGFPAPEAIEHLLSWAESDSPERESAVIGLGKIDYNKLEEPEKWRKNVEQALVKVRQTEELNWMIEEIDRTLTKIAENRLEAKNNSAEEVE